VVTRRGLLAAGGAALLAGCGKDDAAEPPPRPVHALMHELAAERTAVAALAGLPGGADREHVRRIEQRTRDRARRLAAAIAANGGRAQPAPAADSPTAAADPPAVAAGDTEQSAADPSAADPSAAAIAALRAAVAAHVFALPDLTPDLRRLAADLVPEAAADLAVLGAVLGVPAEEPFPGST
jgi:hypothetical protein